MSLNNLLYAFYAWRDYQRGNICVYTNQKVYFMPKEFHIYDDNQRKYTYHLDRQKKEDKELLLKFADELEYAHHLVFVNCGVYLLNNSQLIAKNIERTFSWDVFARFLKSYCKNSECDMMLFSGAAVTVNGVYSMFVQGADSPWKLLMNENFITNYFYYRKGADMKRLKSNQRVVWYSEENQCDSFTFDYVPEEFHMEVAEKMTIKGVCENPELLKRIKEIDEKINKGMKLTGIDTSQWKRIVRPNLIEVAYKAPLGNEAKTQMSEILDAVERGMVQEKKEYEELETVSTLEAVGAFLSINGCPVK